MSQKSEAKAAIKGFGWLSLGRIAGMALSFFSVAVLARMLDPDDFGVMATSLIIISLATAVFDGTFAIGLVQRREIDGDYISSAFWLSMLLAATVVIFICIISPVLGSFFKIERYSAVFSISSISLFFKAAENISVAYMRREGRFGAIALYQFGSSFLGYLPVSLLLALNGFGPWALVFGQLAVATTSGLSSLLLARLPLSFVIKRNVVRDIFQTSGHFTLSQIFNWAALTGSNAVLAHSFGPQALGFYSRAWRLLDLVTGVTAGPLQSVLVPSFARMQDDHFRAREALERALATSTLFFGVLSSLCVVHTEAIVRIALGPKWTSCVPIAQILFAVLVPRCCYKISESATVGFGHSKSVALRQGLYAVLMIGGASIGLFFGPIWVAVGASLAVSMFYFSSVTYAAYVVRMRPVVLLLIHVRAAAIAVTILVIDETIVSSAGVLGFWSAHLLGGFVSSFIVVIGLIALPQRWLSKDTIKVREFVLRRLVVQQLR